MDFTDKEPPDDVERLRREIESLRQRLEESANKGRQLYCDTELLVKKTQNLVQANKVSCTAPNWQKIVESAPVGIEGIWITDVRNVEDIQFIAEFAAKRQLIMTYGMRSFHLEPREPEKEA